MVGKTGFPASESHFLFLHFLTLLSVFLVEKYSRKVFFYEILHSGWWKQIFRLLETVLVSSEFFLQSETVTKLNGSQFVKKTHILTKKILIFGLVETNFLRQHSIATSEAVFDLTRTC